MDQKQPNPLDQLVNSLTPEVQSKLLNLLKLEKEYRETNVIDTFFTDSGPNARDNYPKHVEFINATAIYTELAAIAGNQVGKTLLCAYITAISLTGLYPHWWEGKKWNKPIRAWAVSISGQKVRDNIQKYLLGSLFTPGTGLIPKQMIHEKRGGSSQVSGLVGDVGIYHHNGPCLGCKETQGCKNVDGISWLSFKAYSDGREKFQGEQVDLAWLDEEDKNQQGIYNEIKMRGATTELLILCSFTPLYGLSDMVLSFIPNLEFPESGCGQSPSDRPDAKYKFVCNITWDDVPHISDKKKVELAAGLGEMELLARSRGIPGLGAGLIYPIQHDTLKFIPNSYTWEMFRTQPHAYAMDIAYTTGYTAVLWGTYDEKTDTWFIWDEYKSKGASKADHVQAIFARGKWIPGIIDPSSSRNISQEDRKSIFNSYVDMGLDLAYANNAVEAGIQEVYQRMLSGRLKISVKCQELFKELRIYRRDEDYNIIKHNDHLCDCLRYLIMSGKHVLSTDPSLHENDPYDSYYEEHSQRDKYTGY